MHDKLYLGVDLHKQSCWVTVLNADGHLLGGAKRCQEHVKKLNLDPLSTV